MTSNRLWHNDNEKCGDAFPILSGYKCQAHNKCTVYRVGGKYTYKRIFIHAKTIMQMEYSSFLRCEHGVWLADHCYKCSARSTAPGDVSYKSPSKNTPSIFEGITLDKLR